MTRSKLFILQNQESWIEKDTYGFPHGNIRLTLQPWVITISVAPPKNVKLDAPQVVVHDYHNLKILLATLVEQGILEVIPGGLVGRQGLKLCKVLF